MATSWNIVPVKIMLEILKLADVTLVNKGCQSYLKDFLI